MALGRLWAWKPSEDLHRRRRHTIQRSTSGNISTTQQPKDRGATRNVTVHGSAETSIEQLPLVDAHGRKRPVLYLEIEPQARDRIWRELWALGISKTAIYPEPQSLADDLKRQYNAR